VVKERFGVSEEEISGQYLGMLRKANPSIQDLNRIYPGQLVKLPVFSAQMVRAPIQRKSAPTHRNKSGCPLKGLCSPTTDRDFLLIGEDWTTTANIIFRLKSGGQVNLKADSFLSSTFPTATGSLWISTGTPGKDGPSDHKQLGQL